MRNNLSLILLNTYFVFVINNDDGEIFSTANRKNQKKSTKHNTVMITTDRQHISESSQLLSADSLSTLSRNCATKTSTMDSLSDLVKEHRPKTAPIRLIVVHRYKREESDELSLKKRGQLVLGKHLGNGWWLGHFPGSDANGMFPASHVAVEGSKEAEKVLRKIARKAEKLAAKASFARTHSVADTSSIDIPAPPVAPPPPVAVKTTKECNCCYEEFSISSFSLPSSTCSHEAATCDECLRLHIAEEVGGKGITRQILCPNTDCNKKLEHHEIHKICDQTVMGKITFQRFDNLLFRRTVEEMPEFHWCTGINCGSGQLHIGGTDTNVMRCGGCNAKTCVIHELPHHDGLSCTEYDGVVAQNAETALADVWQQQNTKPCPSCKVRIQKNEGCCHMTCANVEANCTHEFCWHCNATWKSGMLGRRGAHFHETTCCRYSPKQ